MMINLYTSQPQTNEERIDFNKVYSTFIKKARQDATKEHKCFICGKTTKFCNSHSLPRFVLQNIADNGMVLNSMDFTNPQNQRKGTGINNSGSFWLICDTCDNEKFKTYETPENYDHIPNTSMLKQIAQKSYLREIYKQQINKGVHLQIEQQLKTINGNLPEITDIDLNDYINFYNYSNTNANPYHLCFYKKLDYVVPIACQARVTLVTAFDGKLINDIFDLSAKNKPEDLHICIFPLKAKSVIILFVRNGQKKLRPFYRQLQKLSLEEQLQTINFIILAYSEEVFVHKKLATKLQGNKKLAMVCGLTTIHNGFKDTQSVLKETMDLYNLNHAADIPNLLSEDFALK